MIRLLFIFLLLVSPLYAATSDPFPAYEDAPVLTSYFADGEANNTYYIATTGNDTTGDGSIGSPWATINGASTGGAGTPAAAGDLVYFRGGTYTAIERYPLGDYLQGYYHFDNNGTSSDRIVFSAYPGETPVFASIADGNISITLHGDYTVLDSLTFTSGSVSVQSSFVIIQNSTFDGDPYDPAADQINDSHLMVNFNGHDCTIRNSYFSSTNAHSIKAFNRSSMPERLIIKYNVFEGDGYVSFGVINTKTKLTDYVISHNRFVNTTSEAINIGSDYGGGNDGLSVHHNVFDNCSNSVLTIMANEAGDYDQNENVEVYNNIVLNATSGDREFLFFDCTTCYTGATESLGEFYNNAIYGLVDLIYPDQVTDFTNYPDYWNYNAYSSTTIRDTAENENSLSSTYWQGSALIQASHGVTRTGVSGNYFYTIEDNNGFVGAGRNGGNIGGFTFSESPLSQGIFGNFNVTQ